MTCLVIYAFGGNGPWNYFYETPPPGVKTIYQYGLFWGETPTHWLVATDMMTLDDGSFRPIHLKRYAKDSDVEILFGEEAKVRLKELLKRKTNV